MYKNDSTCFAETYIKDHLGNVRVAFGNDGSGFGVRQVNAYYPFGMSIRTLSSNSANTTHRNEYGYNGKMYQDEMGLNWYDYGARFYDPTVARWWSVDPMAEQYRRWTPYNYCIDNPINLNDPTGMAPTVIINGDQAYEATKQLDESSSLNITRDAETGRLSATGNAVSDSDKKLQAAINDQTITINVKASSSTTIEGTNYRTNGGSMLGNTVTQKIETEVINNKPFEIVETSTNTVTAKQQVNPTMLAVYDANNGSKGEYMKHEVNEAYDAALISQTTGVSALPAIRGNATYNSIYIPAHNANPINDVSPGTRDAAIKVNKIIPIIKSIRPF